MKKMNFHLTDKQSEQLEKEKEKTGLMKADIVRRAIDQYFEGKQ